MPCGRCGYCARVAHTNLSYLASMSPEQRDLATASELARVSVREAALYMRIMGWTLEAALWHLCRTTRR